MTRTQATVEDLARFSGKAELVDGEVVSMAPTGDSPNFAAGEIFFSLRQHVGRTGSGRAISDNAAFIVSLPHRQSFSPDAAYYTGRPAGMGFFPDTPAFAVEVRSAGDYGPASERAMAAKRADYFAAGTLVVWDVDLLANEAVVKKYAAGDPAAPTLFRRGDTADAEPALPGWRMAVDDLFR